VQLIQRKKTTMGIDGHKGVVVDVLKIPVYDPYAVKAQTIKTAFETACMLLRIDDIVSGASKKRDD